MDDLLVEFLNESNESVSNLDDLLLKLEESPGDLNIIRDIFRILHTIKGTCGFMGLTRLEKLSHSFENVIDKLRSDSLTVDQDTIQTLFKALDKLKIIMANLTDSGTEGEGEDNEIIQELNTRLDFLNGEISPSEEIVIKEDEAVQSVDLSCEESGQDSINQDEIIPEGMSKSEKKEFADIAKDPEAVQKVEQSKEVAVDQPKIKDADAHSKEESKDGANLSAAQSIRISLDVIDQLMTLVSELVLSRNQLLQFSNQNPNPALGNSLQHLSQITSELQEGIMKTRMQPFQNVLSKFPRVIRDLAKDLNKKVTFTQEGSETEIDRQVLEMMKDPLMHILRNSVDHGIELPTDRVKKGKSETGNVHVRTFHEGGRIVIEIKDDGKGLDVSAIKEKIVEKKLASPSELEELPDSKIFAYVFEAGFSTAKVVSNVSGRGVGMDVVKTNIEKIGGTISLDSILNEGTTITIHIPLTLTIISALLVESENQRFAIPQSSIIELVLVSPHSVHQIEYLKDVPLLKLRDKIVPLVSLSQLLKLSSEKKGLSESFYVLICQISNSVFGIIVDRMFDTQEIVVKPLISRLNNNPYFSGSTILGDGSVVMILEPNGINHTLSSYQGNVQDQAVSSKTAKQGQRAKTLLLVFKTAENQQAVPLALVTRIDEINVNDIYEQDDRMIIKYRNHLLPIVYFSDAVHKTCLEKRSNKQKSQESTEDEIAQQKEISVQNQIVDELDSIMPILIFSDRGRSMGLIVNEICNIFEENLDVKLMNESPGVLGTTIIDGQPTSIIDCEHYLKQAYTDWFDVTQQDAKRNAPQHKGSILFIDDSPFFRNLIAPVLTIAGYDVTTASDGLDGLKAYKQMQGKLDCILSDIEMPNMNGYEFAQHIQNLPEWLPIPLIALSGRNSEEDFEKSRQVGFSDYIVKSDQQTLLRTLKKHIKQQNALDGILK